MLKIKSPALIGSSTNRPLLAPGRLQKSLLAWRRTYFTKCEWMIQKPRSILSYQKCGKLEQKGARGGLPDQTTSRWQLEVWHDSWRGRVCSRKGRYRYRVHRTAPFPWSSLCQRDHLASTSCVFNLWYNVGEYRGLIEWTRNGSAESFLLSRRGKDSKLGQVCGFLFGRWIWAESRRWDEKSDVKIAECPKFILNNEVRTFSVAWFLAPLLSSDQLASGPWNSPEDLP